MVKAERLALLALLLLAGCFIFPREVRRGVVPAKIVSNFRYCYTGDTVPECLAIAHQKVYWNRERIYPAPSKYYTPDTVRNRCLVFYPNGLTASISLLGNDPYEVKEFLSLKPFKHSVSGLVWAPYGIQWRWGSYRIEADTLKVQNFGKPVAYSSYEGANETRYLLLPDGSLEEHGRFSMEEPNKEALASTRDYYGRQFRILPEVEAPTSDSCWLLKEEWFWCKNRERLGLRVGP